VIAHQPVFYLSTYSSIKSLIQAGGVAQPAVRLLSKPKALGPKPKYSNVTISFMKASCLPHTKFISPAPAFPQHCVYVILFHFIPQCTAITVVPASSHMKL
jgi:hypothetical protein